MLDPAAETLPPVVMDAIPKGDLLIPYQARALGEVSHHSLSVYDKSRRIGFTWGVLAPYAVEKAAASKSEGGSDVWYISYAHDMTREFIDACAQWAKVYTLAAADMGEFLFEDQDEHGHSRQIKAFRITFASGHEIVGLSSAPRSIRGKQGVVMIDEAAFVDSLDELLKAALALLMWGGQVIVVSTHNGVDNPFNKLIDEIESGEREGYHDTITFADALAEGLYERICLVSGKEASAEGKAAWEAKIRKSYGSAASEELDCIPSQGAGALISMEKIMACTHRDAGKPALYTGGLVTLGRDVAVRKDGDLPVIHAYEMAGAMLWQRERWSERGATFAAQDREFDRMFKDYRVLRALIDQTGMGEKVVEDAIGRHGNRVEGVLFTGPNRLDLALCLAQRFEEETIRIEDDKDLRRDLRAIKKKKGKGKTVQIVDDGEVHADEFWAAALACLAAATDAPTCHGFMRAEKGPRKFDEPASEERDGRMRMRPDDLPETRRFLNGAW